MESLNKEVKTKDSDKTRVLIIDDEMNVRKILRVILEDEGYEVEEAASGSEGMEIYRDHHVDLIIADIFMPDMDGLEVIMDLRRSSTDTKIIAISGGSDVLDVDYLPQAKKLGANRIFSKPFNAEDLMEAVRELTKKIS